MPEIFQTKTTVVVFFRRNEDIDFRVLYNVRKTRKEFLVFREYIPCHYVHITSVNEGVRIVSNINVECIASDFQHVKDDIWRGTFALLIVKDNELAESLSKFILCLVKESKCYFVDLVDLSWLYDRNCKPKTIFYFYDRGYIRPYP